jgi:putative hemolysin
MNIVAEIIFLILLILLAAVTAASEIAIMAAGRFKLRKLSSEGSKAAKTVIKIREVPERFFSTILVLNNIVDALIAVLVAAAMIKIVGKEEAWAVTLATLVSAFLIIVSEVTSKTIAARHPEKMALFMAMPMYYLIRISHPLVRGFESITSTLANLLGGKAPLKPSLLTEEEIKAFIKIGGEEGVLHKDKYRMLTKVFDFSEAMVKDVMTAKNNVISINVNSQIGEIIDNVIESGYSRLPVYRDRPDNIIGIINMKDLLSLSQHKDLIVLHDIVYPATFVPGSKKVRELLSEFQKGHTHLAIVTDDAGKMQGIVTLEDLIEEIVGEIEDESDVRSSNYKARRI